jgi:hypothetical protein
MAAQDSMSQVQDQVREIGDGMKNSFTFPNQRKAASDWWNDKVGQARGLWDKYAGSGDVKAAESPAASPQPKTVSASTTTPSIKRSAAKRKSAGGGMNKSFGGMK